MSRELRRVPLDFDWPLNKVWIGYVNPYDGPAECRPCGGSGLGPQAKAISDSFYGLYAGSDYVPIPDHPTGKRYNPKAWAHSITQDEVDALVEHGRLMDFTHAWTSERRWQPKDPPYQPTAEEVNHWHLYGWGHDGINRWILIEARLKRLGLSDDKCQICQGDGAIWQSRYAEEAFDGWSSWEPPTGEGWQVWETVSEGSPISPVCSTRDVLIAWMRTVHIGWDAMTKAGAEAFVEQRYVPSGVITPGHGVETGLGHLDRTAWMGESS